jgi:pimeloyl-ACP methyl ester carboxylesterase
MIAVLDAVGFERPALVGATSGGGAIQFAARYSDRVSALVLFNADAVPEGALGCVSHEDRTCRGGWFARSDRRRRCSGLSFTK